MGTHPFEKLDAAARQRGADDVGLLQQPLAVRVSEPVHPERRRGIEYRDQDMLRKYIERGQRAGVPIKRDERMREEIDARGKTKKPKQEMVESFSGNISSPVKNRFDMVTWLPLQQ